MRKLWEIDNPYYCSESNFYSNDPYCRHSSWKDFSDTMGKSDGELNLLFRWDWQAPHIDGDSENDFDWQGDENYRDSTLQLFWVMQRKGIFACHEISVCRADEPAIKAWLIDRMKHVIAFWSPLQESPNALR